LFSHPLTTRKERESSKATACDVGKKWPLRTSLYGERNQVARIFGGGRVFKDLTTWPWKGGGENGSLVLKGGGGGDVLLIFFGTGGKGVYKREYESQFQRELSIPKTGTEGKGDAHLLGKRNFSLKIEKGG